MCIHTGAPMYINTCTQILICCPGAKVGRGIGPSDPPVPLPASMLSPHH